MQTSNIPPRMFMSEVLALAKFGYSTMRKKQKRGEFPSHIDRGKEYIFSGPAVYQALGLMPAQQESDAIMDALNRMG